MSTGDAGASSLAANLSTLYGHLPLVDRAAAASRDGHTKVESWWDFETATPTEHELDAFATSIESADVQLIAVNSHGGDRLLGERGLASLPDRRDEFKASITGVAAMARRLGVQMFNVAAGNRDDRFALSEQRATALANYRWASNALAEVGGTVLIEALGEAGNPSYPFRTGYDVVEFIGEPDLLGLNIAFLFDTFHLASNGVDLVAAWRALSRHVGHVQLADAPGRGEPGTGTIDFATFLEEVRASGYRGDISLEYFPPAP